MTIVLSTGRTGTNYLAETLLRSASIDEIRHQRFGSRPLNIWGNVSVLSKGRLNRINRFILDRIIDKSESQIIVDPLLSMLLLDMYGHDSDNDNKVIQLVRDPRDFVTSFMSWKSGSIKKRVLHHVIPLWQPSPWLAGDVSIGKRIRMNKFEHFCWIWNFKNTLIYNCFSGRPNFLLVKFEDMVSERKAKGIFLSILQFIDGKNTGTLSLPAQSKKVNKSFEGGFPDWRNWSPNQASILNYWCGDLMKTLGYGDEPEWKELIARA